MNKILVAAALALAGFAAATASSSAAITAPGAAAAMPPLAQPVRDGCGRGNHADQWGNCVQDRYYRPRYEDDGGSGYYDEGYRDQRRYYRQPVDRGYCPPGRHPGNSGRCVSNW